MSARGAVPAPFVAGGNGRFGSLAAVSIGRNIAAGSSTGRSRLAASPSSIARGPSASSAASDAPGGSGANSGLADPDHFGAAGSGDRSSPVLGGGAAHDASSGAALEGAVRKGCGGDEAADQSAT